MAPKEQVASGADDRTDDAVWPDLIVAGTPRTATTSLYHYLGSHPEVFVPPVEEPQFFGTVWNRCEGDADALRRAEADYLALFEDAAGHAVVCDVSSSYLCAPKAPARILENVPDARIVTVLRDPVQRAFSHFLFNVREGWEDRSFAEAVEADIDRGAGLEGDSLTRRYVGLGFYADAVERYLDAFGEDRVLVLLFEDLEADRVAFMQTIARFAGVDPAPFADLSDARVYNPYGTPRNRLARWLRSSPTVRRLARTLLPLEWRVRIGEGLLMRKPDKPDLPADVRDRLVEVYAPDVEALEELLGRDLPELRRSWDDQGADGEGSG